MAQIQGTEENFEALSIKSFSFQEFGNFRVYRGVLNLVLPVIMIQPFTLVLTLRMCFNNVFFPVKYTDMDVLRNK